MQIIKDIEQGTKAWHDIRRCKITGTCLQDIMGTDSARTNLIAELIAEEATEQAKMFKATAEMERGTNEEPFAIKAFEERTSKKIDESCGFCVSDEFDWFGFSPDGFILDENGKYTEGVEVKSPDSKTAILYRMSNIIPPEELKLSKAKQSFLGIPLDYKWQIVAAFLMNKDLLKMNFLVYDARFIRKEDQLYIVEVFRDEPAMQEAIEQADKSMRSFRADWTRWKAMVLPSNF